LRPPKFPQLDDNFETLIGESGTTAGNHRCVPSDVAGVLGGQGCIPPAPGCAVRRQAPVVAGAAWRLQGPRCPAWLVHACIIVSLGGWHAPEEAGRFGGEEDGMGVQRRKASRARQGCSTHSCEMRTLPMLAFMHSHAFSSMMEPARLRHCRNCCATFHVDEQSPAEYECRGELVEGVILCARTRRCGMPQIRLGLRDRTCGRFLVRAGTSPTATPGRDRRSR
jgi:hypothetical protein